MKNEQRAFGAIFSPPDVRDYKLVCAKGTEMEFPKEFELQMRRVKDQRTTGSCVGHSLSSILEYYNYTQNNDDTELSVGYIYGNRRKTSYKGEGLVMRDALATVRQYGDCSKNLFPYNEEVPRAISLFEAQGDALYPVAYPHHISEYVRLNDANTIKLSLLAGFPVTVALKWYNDIEVDENGVAHSDFKEKDYGGGHCTTLCGYNEYGFKILNSWGDDWGDNGYFIWPYEYPIEEAWSVVDNEIEGIIIKKPYKSKVGKIFAKIINKVRNIFY